jgi:hypothetical protein
VVPRLQDGPVVGHHGCRAGPGRQTDFPYWLVASPSRVAVAIIYVNDLYGRSSTVVQGLWITMFVTLVASCSPARWGSALR